MTTYEILIGDCLNTLKTLPAKSINTCITSPPYFGLRDYGRDGQLGMETTPDEFVEALVRVFRDVRRVLRDDGTVWLNLGDSYGKRGQLHGIPWRVALALQDDGWTLRQDIIWHKPNPMPESVKTRCTKAHEYVFLLSKGSRYYYDNEAAKEPSVDPTRVRSDAIGHTQRKLAGRPVDRQASQSAKRNRRSVWTVTTRPYKGAHFATFPPDLIAPCILAGCPEGGTVLDPFGGSGTTAGVAVAHDRQAILCELNPEYAELVPERVKWVADYYEKQRPANDNVPKSANDNPADRAKEAQS